METKVIRRFFGLADFIEEQEFLQKEHRQGWRFKKFEPLRKYTFEKCEPAEFTYQLDFKEDGKNEEEYIQMFKDCGWEYIMKYQRWYYFRKEKSEHEIENSIFSDPESKIGMCQKVYKYQMIINIAFCLVQMFALFFFLRSSNSILKAIFLIETCLLLILLTFLFTLSIKNFNKLKKMMNELKHPLDDNKIL